MTPKPNHWPNHSVEAYALDSWEENYGEIVFADPLEE